MIGSIGLLRIEPEHYRGEVGYALLPEYFRRGIMSEALDRILTYAWAKTPMHSIEARVNPENQGSIVLLEAAGFLKEAHLRENHYWAGRFLDTYVYGLVRPHP